MLMIRSFIAFWMISIGYFGVLDRIQKAIEKKDYPKAKELIYRAYEKGPENPGIFYFHAVLLFSEAYPEFHADSARILISQAIKTYPQSTSEIKDQLEEEEIHLKMLQDLSTEIENFLFSETIDELSIDAIELFMEKYPQSRYESILTYKRDSLAFSKSKRAGLENGYVQFMQNYPSSVFYAKADSLLDRVRYRKLANHGRLEDYVAFKKLYPTSNHLGLVEAYILKHSTASQLEKSIHTFIQKCQTPSLKKKAADVLYYQRNRLYFEEHPLKDSLKQMIQLAGVALFPVLEPGGFGFQSTTGQRQVPYVYSEIQEGVKCKTSIDDWMYVKDNKQGLIVLKNGRKLLERIEDYESVSSSLALIKRNGYSFLYHKSGFMVLKDPVEKAEPMDNGWIKVFRNNKWGLYSVFGLEIAPIGFDDIESLGSFLVFKREDKLGLYSRDRVLEEIDKHGLSIEFKFDDLELVNDELVIGFNDKKECLIDHTLQFLIPWGEYEIHPDPTGWYLRKQDGYYLYGDSTERVIDKRYLYLESSTSWLALKSEDDWLLMPKDERKETTGGYDSIKLINDNSALLFQEGKRSILFNTGEQLYLGTEKIETFPRRSEYLMISDQINRALYNGENMLFRGKYDRISFLSDSLLKVSVHGKQGIIDIRGNSILQPIYESIDEKDDLILTLLRGGIGCYDIANDHLLPPKYESRISKINGLYLVKKGGYHLIDVEGNEIFDQEFDKISYWNDSSYLVSKKDKYLIVNRDGQSVLGGLDTPTRIAESGKNQIFKTLKDGKFGLISTQGGIILDFDYSDIVSIGTENDPLFFADQHLSNAGYHVVSYVNTSGKLIFSKAYRKKEFDKILCAD